MGSRWHPVLVAAVLLASGVSGLLTPSMPPGPAVLANRRLPSEPASNSVATAEPTQTPGTEIGLLSPFNYAVLPPGEPIRLRIEDSLVDRIVYALDAGPGIAVEPPFEIDTSAWPEGFHTVDVHAVREDAVVGERAFAFTIDPDAAWPPDTVRMEVVLIGIDVPPEDLRVRLTTAYDIPTRLSPRDLATHTFELRLDVSVRTADASYRDTMAAHLRSIATYRDDVQARLNLSALVAQRDDGVARDIFDLLEGWEIPTAAVEAYLAQVPPVPASDARVTFYLADLASLDDPTAGVDHWYVRPTPDPDTGRDQDWWRLEWDNDLNTPMGYPLNVFGGRGRTVFVDPTAYQWYIDWASVWWGSGSEPSPASVQYETVPSGERAAYLAGIVNDLVAGLLGTLPWAPPDEPMATIRSYVLSGSDAYGLDNLRWVVRDALLRDYLAAFLPWMTWRVDTTYARIEDFPDLRGAVDGSTTFDGLTGRVNGSAVWEYLRDHREAFVLDEPDGLEVLTVSLLYDNRSMVLGGREFTGLGGVGITAIVLRTDRLFDADGVRQKGLTSVISHETGHSLGYGHQFGPNYRADFVDGNMGYFRNELGYGTFWEDALHRVYIRERLLRLLARLDERPPLPLEPEFRSFYAAYGSLDFLAAHGALDGVEAVLDDGRPPAVEILAPEPGAYVPTSNVVVEWSATDVGSGLFRIEVELPAQGTVRLDASATRYALAGLPDDGYAVTVRALDRAGNTGAGSVTFRVDTIDPRVSILTPRPGAVLPPGDVAVRWTTSDASPIVRTEVTLDDGAPVVLEGPASDHTFVGVPPGVHGIRVTARDAAGHEGGALIKLRVEAAPPRWDLAILVGSSLAGGAAIAAAWLLHRRRRSPP